mmetsp:Transcript_13807/g.31042  ORF Transcript_13807/g.31042 Transcript_13807/m.31042 type:complete len:229 (+) Transcript_13807:947-1633(+)
MNFRASAVLVSWLGPTDFRKKSLDHPEDLPLDTAHHVHPLLLDYMRSVLVHEGVDALAVELVEVECVVVDQGDLGDGRDAGGGGQALIEADNCAELAHHIIRLQILQGRLPKLQNTMPPIVGALHQPGHDNLRLVRDGRHHVAQGLVKSAHVQGLQIVQDLGERLQPAFGAGLSRNQLLHKATLLVPLDQGKFLLALLRDLQKRLASHLLHSCKSLVNKFKQLLHHGL